MEKQEDSWWATARSDLANVSTIRYPLDAIYPWPCQEGWGKIKFEYEKEKEREDIRVH